MPLLLALDLGTTSTRALVMTADGRVRGRAARPLATQYPEPGRVKTRLGAHVGFERATEWAKALLVASLRRFGTIPGAPLILAGDRLTREPYAPWLPPEVGYCVQGEGSLGDRLTRIFGEPPRLDGAMPPGVIALGADAPHLDPTVICGGN